MFMRVIGASRLHRVCTTCPPIPLGAQVVALWVRFLGLRADNRLDFECINTIGLKSTGPSKLRPTRGMWRPRTTRLNEVF